MGKNGDGLFDDSTDPNNWTFNGSNATTAPIKTTIGLKVENAGGCSSIATQVLTINPVPYVVTKIDTIGDGNCSPLQLKLKAKVLGGGLSRWEDIFGGISNTISNTDTALYVLSNSTNAVQSHKFTFTARNSYGCSATKSNNIPIYPYIDAIFSVVANNGCSPTKLHYEANYFEGAEYRWDWDGNGTVDSTFTAIGGTNPIKFSRTYYNTGNTVLNLRPRLTVRKLSKPPSSYCVKTMQHADTIKIYPRVRAGFNATPLSGCNPLDVSFVNTSSLSASSFRWSFGDGGSSVEKNPTHLFENTEPNDKSYTVQLIAESLYGCADTLTKNITVHPYIDAHFAIDTSSGCSPLKVTFNYNLHAGITMYRFDWGDGSFETRNKITATGVIAHTYNNTTNLPITRRAKLKVYYGLNLCVDSMAVDIVVYPEIVAGFTVPVAIGCSPLLEVFVNTSHYKSPPNSPLVNASYVWNFDDGSSSIDKNPTHYFANTGGTDVTYNISMLAQSEYGCTSVALGAVTVHPFIEALFATDTSSGCSPLDVTFNYATHPSVAQYRWSWGDGGSQVVTTATGNISHRYINKTGLVQIYPAQLIIDNGSGCLDTMQLPITVYPEVAAHFTMPTSSGCNPFEVTFQNTSLFVNAGQLTNTDASFLWSFGDGSSSTSFEPSHTFVNTLGVDTMYNVTLSVSSNYGCTSSTTAPVTVFPAIAAQFAIDTSSGCSPLNLGFIYTVHPGITHYVWDWNGDGSEVDTTTSTTGRIWHRYTNRTGLVQNLTPTLKVLNANGCGRSMSMPIQVYPEVTSRFAVVDTSGCNPLTAQFNNNSHFTGTVTPLTGATYVWNFGDGTSSTAVSPVHIFTNTTGIDAPFDVELVVHSQYGCSDRDTVQVRVFPAIAAHFAIDTSSGCSPLNIGFSYTVHPGITHYIWDWNGDGTAVDTTTSTTGNIWHQYVNQTSALLNVSPTLTVLNVNGCNRTMSMPISIYPEVRAGFAMSDSSGCNPLAVSFSNRSAFLNGVGLMPADAAFHWNFGDGTTSTLFEPAHTFTNSFGVNATPSVTLSVSSIHGCTASSTVPVTVFPAIAAHFAIDTSFGCSPLNIGFSYTVHPGITHYVWDWNGDGSEVDTTTSTTGKIWHRYTNRTGLVQNLTPTLKVLNVNGCGRSMSIPIEIYPEVVSKFSLVDTTGCNPLVAQFNNTSHYTGTATPLTGATYTWNFGDGASSTEVSPLHTFTNITGIDAPFDVELVVRSQHGCHDRDTVQVRVFPFIDAHFAIDTSSGCSPLDVLFKFNKYSGISQYRFNWGDGTPSDTLQPTSPPQVRHTYINKFGMLKKWTPTLVVENHAGCLDSAKIDVKIYPEITAAFVPDTIRGCNELNINFANQSHFTGTANALTNTRYYWDYGDGGSSEAVSPSHIFINNDVNDNETYTTKLLAISEYGCKDSVTTNIEVYNRVESHFTFEQASNCTPFDVTFTSAALGASTYIWSYGAAPNLPNDTLYTDNTFTRRFTNNHPSNIAHYNITLEVANNEGCRHAQTRIIEVYPIVKAAISPSVIAGCSNLPVNFTNSSTGGSLVSVWHFGDGESASNSNGADVNHTYVNRGSVDSVYTVGLLVINPNGCRDSITTNITVYPKVEAGFVFAQQSHCTPFYLDLTNTSLNGNTFSWDFGYGGLDTIVYTTQSFQYLFDNFTDNDILNYTIRLISSDSRTGCADTTTKGITVYPRVITRFVADVAQGCNPLTVNFSNNSTGLGTYLWEFGDGSTSNAVVPPPHIFSHPYTDQTRTYQVKLTTTNHFGCKSHRDTLIAVYPFMKANFQWDKYEGCTPLTVNLNNSSVSPQYNYTWNFGDGSTSTVEQPVSHTFINPTHFPPQITHHTISLAVSFVKNGLTCSDTMKRPINVFPHIYPDFTASFAGCHPHSESFTNTTIAFSNNNRYDWDLGNGLFDIVQNPSLTYYNTSRTRDSIFTVQLTAISEHGCLDSVEHNVTVHPRPYAAMELVSDYISCPQFDVELTNQSIGTNLTNHYLFGDGQDSTTTSMANMTHQYTNSGSTTVPFGIQLNVVSEFGCDDSVYQTVYVYPNVVANYTVDPSHSGCSPFEVQFNSAPSQNARYYLWNFDNGLTSSFSTPKHLFINTGEADKTFDVTLYASSEFGCFDVDTQRITAYAKPIVSFAVEPPLKKYPDATFNITNQSAPAADSWTYQWDFGDFQYSSAKHPGTHTYLSWAPRENNFKYNVSLKIVSPHCKDSLSTTIYLLPADPFAKFYSEVDSSCSPLEVNFINISEYGENYLWDFGDGTTSTEMEPTHTFIAPGYYNVKLTVNGDGGSRFYYQTYRVYQNPVANFVVSPSRVMLPNATIHAYNLSQNYTRSLWDLGDGTISTDKDPVHTYKKIGEYKVSLWAYMDYGNDVCMDSISRSPASWVEGKGLIRFPNAFKPNQEGPNGGIYDEVDYKNQVFHPYHYGVTTYKLIILNRWGEQLFTSTDVNIGWDGWVNGRLATQGVYVWRAVGRFTNDEPFDMQGTLTLIR